MRDAVSRFRWIAGQQADSAVPNALAGKVPDQSRRRGDNRVRMYGVTPAAFDALLEAQGGRCAICRCDEWPGKKNAPHTDHDHATGAVRGLLCHHCNVMLGNAKDDPAILRAAAEYLERAASLADKVAAATV